MTIYKNVIHRNNGLGIYKYAPNIDWSAIVNKATTIMNARDIDSEMNILKRYIAGDGVDLSRVSSEGCINLSYFYITKTGIPEDITDEINTLISDMKSRPSCISSIGHDRLSNTRNWDVIAPHISNNINTINNLIFSTFYSNNYDIYYINRNIPEELIEFFECVSDSKVNKYDDNTYVFETKVLKSKLMILTGDYTDETIAKHIFKLFDLDENLFDKNFIYTTPLDSTINKSVNEIQLKKLIFNTILGQDIDRLHTYDNEIIKTLNTYNLLLNNRLHLINELSNKMLDVFGVRNLIDTLDKMSKTLSWKVSTIGSSLIIKLTTPLFNYDERIAKKLIDTGKLDDYLTSSDVWIKKLFEDCFVKNTKQIMTETYITINFKNRTFSSHRCYTDLRATYASNHIKQLSTNYECPHKYIPNPHISRYNCWGQNGPVLVKLFTERKYEEMLYCLKATLGNINFNDTTVVGYFIAILDSVPTDFVLCTDIATGNQLTKADLIKEYNDEKNQDN